MSVLTKEKISAIPRAESAEKAGVDSKEVQAFIDDCESNNIEVHSIIVMRHGKVACEAYKEPFGPDHAHMMYSVSKSFTSTAIAFAIEEGYITLQTKFLDVFPEFRPEKYDPYLEKLNVYHLITMQSGKGVSPMLDRTKDRWLKDFVDSPWVFEPGEGWLYINENIYVLCAIIHRVTGMSVTEWLTPRLYEPLGMETPYWETCPSGIEAGGWGLFLKPEDLAKFTLCYQQNGKWNGQQVIPEYWTKEGTSNLHDNSGSKVEIDSIAGYGYCFWRCGGYKNSYRADGMFSQFGIVFEDIDAAIAIQAGNIDEQQTRDAVWRHFPKAFIEDNDEIEGITPEFPPYEKMPKLPRSFLEKSLDGKTVNFGGTHILNIIGMPVSVLPLASVFMEKDKAGEINNIKFKFLPDSMLFTWSEGDETNTVEVGMDGEYRWSKIVLGGISYNTASTAAWTSENVLEVRIRPIETIAERRLEFRFKDGNRVTMQPSTMPPSSIMLDNVKNSIKDVIASEFIGNLANKVIPLANPFADPAHHGKIN